MPKIKLSIVPDTTFLNSLLTEGILFMIARGDINKISFKDNLIEISEDAIGDIYSKLDDNEIRNIELKATGNDNNVWFGGKHQRGLFNVFNIRLEKQEKSNEQDVDEEEMKGEMKTEKSGKLNSYSDILLKLKENHKNLLIRHDFEIIYDINGKSFKIGEGDITAPQLLKCERYTGISSLEVGLTNEQITLRSSAEALLIALLGVYSGYVITSGFSANYFLFFMPEEALNLLRSGKREMVEQYIEVKTRIKNLLKNVLKYSRLSMEAIIIEIIVNLETIKALEKHNLDKISLILFRIDREGQTYKIYELIPIYLYKKAPIYDILRKYFGENLDNFCNVISDAITNGVIGKNLANYSRGVDIKEASDLLSAIHNLYRFVALADTSGLFGFIRNLRDASKVVYSEGRRSADVKAYLSLLENIEFYARKF